jgi:hypothetical protein
MRRRVVARRVADVGIAPLLLALGAVVGIVGVASVAFGGGSYVAGLVLVVAGLALVAAGASRMRRPR